MCLLTLEVWENLAPQISQRKGLSPVCVYMYVFRCALCENLAPKISQGKRFSRVCVDVCCFKLESGKLLNHGFHHLKVSLQYKMH